MKVGQGNAAGGMQAALIEQMQKAHAESVSESGKAGGSSRQFSVGSSEAAGAANAPEAVSPLDKKLVGIAERVINGEISDENAVRTEVLHAIVDERYGDMFEPRQKRQALKTLQHTLTNDPNFSREVDQLLIFASRQI